MFKSEISHADRTQSSLLLKLSCLVVYVRYWCSTLTDAVAIYLAFLSLSLFLALCCMNHFRPHAFAVAVVKEDRSLVLSQMTALTGEAKSISCEKRADTEKS